MERTPGESVPASPTTTEYGPPLFPALKGIAGALPTGSFYRRGQVTIHFQAAENLYETWPSPICIISDGPYGVNGFPGDEQTARTLDR